MAEELIENIAAIKELTLVPSGGGVFTIDVDGRRIFDKKETGRFPNKGEAVQLVRQLAQ